jgi:hypothetical protein
LTTSIKCGTLLRGALKKEGTKLRNDEIQGTCRWCSDTF